MAVTQLRFAAADRRCTQTQTSLIGEMTFPMVIPAILLFCTGTGLIVSIFKFRLTLGFFHLSLPHYPTPIVPRLILENT